MLPESTDVQAYLEMDGEKIPICAQFSSKYSLLVRFLNRDGFKHGEEFSKLVCHFDERGFELGPCKLIAEPNIEGFAGRLIFLEDVYDVENLFQNKDIVTLQSVFRNLPLILARKDKINKPFREFTADLTYDLSIYKNLFDRLDFEYANESETIKRSIQKSIIQTEGRKLMRFLDDKIAELENLVAVFNKEEHEHHGFYFRKQLWHIIMCSPFMARTNLKPRGYSGDSEMMRMIYANDYQGDSTFAKIMHKHPLEHPAAQAVRNRRKLISNMLKAIIKKHTPSTGENIKILSVACGPAFELQDILIDVDDCRLLNFTLLDQDRSALFAAARLIADLEKAIDTKISVTYLNESVRTMLSMPKIESRWGQFHYIYSMGLFDYLTPPVAKAVLSKLYQLLTPGGEMVIGNFHSSNKSKYYMEYWLDWVLYYRTDEEFKRLLGDAPKAETKVSFEDTGSQMFLQVTKKQ